MLSRSAPDLHREGCGYRVWHDHQLHHEERYRSGAGPEDCAREQGLANGDLSPGDTGRAGRYRVELHQRNISGVPQQRGYEASFDGLGEGRGMIRIHKFGWNRLKLATRSYDEINALEEQVK